MIDIKDKTLFFRPLNSKNDKGINVLLSFLELAGSNILVVVGDESQYCSHRSNRVGNKVNYAGKSISEVILKNIFRVDIIVVSINAHKIEEEYTEIRKVTDKPIIFDVIRYPGESLFNFLVSESDASYLFDDENNWIKIESDLRYKVKDLKNGWESNFKELKKSWIRNKKLNDLFGEDD